MPEPITHEVNQVAESHIINCIWRLYSWNNSVSPRNSQIRGTAIFTATTRLNPINPSPTAVGNPATSDGFSLPAPTRRPIVADDTEKKNFPRSLLQAGPDLMSLSAHSRTTLAMSSPRGFKGRSLYTLS